MGPLPDDDARNSISVPFGRWRVSIDREALDHVVADSHGYPYFLQLWGRELWDAVVERGLEAVGMAECAEAEGPVERRKDAHYRGYFNEISGLDLLLPAKALAEAFPAPAPGADGRRVAAMRSARALAIVASMTDPSLGAVERVETARRLMERLKAKDVLWEPGGGVAEASLPSFHSFIRANADEMIEELRRVGVPVPGGEVPAAPGGRGDSSGRGGR